MDGTGSNKKKEKRWGQDGARASIYSTADSIATRAHSIAAKVPLCILLCPFLYNAYGSTDDIPIRTI